jgi:L-ascorbate metabolism protein UlaG (beta-lactamase superfamily)
MLFQFRWLGNAGFEFQIHQTTIIVDPFLTRPQLLQVFFGRVQPDETALQSHIQRCDHILVTHAHFDHCMDAPEIALRCGAQVHGSANTCRLMQAAGLFPDQTHEINSGDIFTINDVRVSVLPAAHPWIPGYNRGKLKPNLKFPIRLMDYRMDTCFSFLIDTNDSRILVWSSTHTAGAPRADLLTCRAVSSQRWYDELLGLVQPKLVIPQHWDDTYQPLSENPKPFYSAPRPGIPPVQRIHLEDFQKKVIRADTHCQVLLPRIFQTYHPDFQEAKTVIKQV